MRHVILKSLLTLSAACMALSGMAAPQPEKIPVPNLRSFPDLSEVKPHQSLTVGHKPTGLKAPSRLNSEHDFISYVEGNRVNMTVYGSGFYLFWGLFLETYIDQYNPSHVVYGENNEVYIYDIIPYTGLGTYTKGTLDGNKVTIELPQTLYFDTEYQEGYNLTMLHYYEWEDVDEEGNPVTWATYVEDENPGSITFEIGEDGTWNTTVLDADSGEKVLGITTWSDGEWTGYGVVDLRIEPFNDKLVEVPEDIEVAENYWSVILDDSGWTANFVQDNDTLYLQGLSAEMPEAWLMATVSHDGVDPTVSFAQNQYLGVYDRSYYAYLKFASYKEGDLTLKPEDYEYEFIWDVESKTMKPKDPDVYFLFNTSKNEVGYIEKFKDPHLLHQDSFEGTPADPYDLVFEDLRGDDGEGFFSLDFNVPTLSTEGGLLLSEDLYYQVYVDGEPWTFNAEEYGIPETLTEVPWNFGANHIFIYFGTWRSVDFFEEGMSTVGVQSIYKYDGKETRSNIVTIKVDSSVNDIDSEKEVGKIKYYDLTGREIAHPADGLYVKQTTYSDGTVRSTKVIL